MLFHESNAMGHNTVVDVLVLPQRFLASLHVTDTGNSVNNGLIVSMIGTRLHHRQLFRMGLAQRLAGKRFLVADIDGIIGVGIDHLAILHPYAGNTVARSSHNVGIIETDILQSRFYQPIPVLLSGLVTHTQVPLPYGCRRIASLLEQVGHRILFRADNHTRITRSDTCIRTPPGIMPGQERITRGRTGGSH